MPEQQENGSVLITAEEEGYRRALSKDCVSIRDFDIDAFADGVVAHRNGVQFHENPHGADALTLRRLSWTIGWNERALQQP